MSSGESRSADGGLTPDVAALIDDYFARFRVEALAAGAHGWEDAVEDLRAHVGDRLDGSARTPEDVVRVLAELGPTEALVAAYADASPEEDWEGLLPQDGSPKRTGRFLGVPYDMHAPNFGRYAIRLWNPLDRRVLVPKSLGMGWTVNFGALAVLTRIVRPDDEDAPFGAVPPRIVAATLAAPLAALAAFAVLSAVSWAQLPALVPMHWGISGHADGYRSRGASQASVALNDGGGASCAGGVGLPAPAPVFQPRCGLRAQSLADDSRARGARADGVHGGRRYRALAYLDRPRLHSGAAIRVARMCVANRQGCGTAT